ncbi:MAG TPA: rhodanese-like domain-containing protein [Candidatus Saccharimonadales bacterium]|nr:rhodanese-like domain-containing protein [Candidatus Saccharimonadales bacterium]
MQNEKNQHKVFVFGFLLIVLVVLGFLLKPVVMNWKDGQKNQAEQKANAEILKAPSVMPDDLFQMIQDKSKVFLVDISAPDDFKRGHIALAVNVPMEKLDKSFISSLGAEKTANIFIVNQGSDLAALATVTNKIVSDGFVNAKYLRGGISGWIEKGFPLVSLGGSEEDNAKVKKITIDEIKNDAGSTPDLLQFLDVRSKDDFAKEHIVGALNIPLTELETRKDDIPAVKKIIVYGSDENESFQAAVTLFDLNFFNVWQMDGGINEWKAAGGNIASGK